VNILSVALFLDPWFLKTAWQV